MRLLVSVRSAAETVEAAAGGADIVDAKEPTRGSLGAVEPAVLRAIAGALPAAHPLSVALGDCIDAEAAGERVATALDAVAGRPREAPCYLKIGFQGAREAAAVERVLRAAILQRGRAEIIAVAYADHAVAAAADPATVVRAASECGAAGVLLDTWSKDGRTLLDWMTDTALHGWVAGAARLGLLTALAGSLDLSTLPSVLASGADIVGVRGAACEGGRAGQVTASRVGRLRALVRGPESASVAGY